MFFRRPPRRLKVLYIRSLTKFPNSAHRGSLAALAFRTRVSLNVSGLFTHIMCVCRSHCRAASGSQEDTTAGGGQRSLQERGRWGDQGEAPVISGMYWFPQWEKLQRHSEEVRERAETAECQIAAISQEYRKLIQEKDVYTHKKCYSETSE